MGSTSSESSAAPAIFPDLSASAQAASLTMPPRAELTRIAVSFIFSKAAASIMSIVEGSLGQCSEITSASAIRVSRSTRRAFSQAGESSGITASYAITSMPIARAFSPVTCPIEPKPIIPIVRPVISLAPANLARSQPPPAT